jgi:HD-GYP domain-containing protein (c-di-GMP phosphodiesterase class II)
MEELKVTELKPGDFMERPLFHASGEMLLEAGHAVSKHTIASLEEAGIGVVYRPERGTDAGEFIHGARNLSIDVANLDVGHHTTKPLFDRDGTLLIDEGLVIGDRLAERLQQRGVHRIYVRKDASELRLAEVQAFRSQLLKGEAAIPSPVAEEIDASRIIKAEDCDSKTLDRIIDSGAGMKVRPGDLPLANELVEHHPLESRTAARKDGFMLLHEESVRTTSQVFDAFRDQREIDATWIGSVTRRTVGALIEDHDLLINLAGLGTPYEHLISQSLGATILAIAAATVSGYDKKQVLEMGYCAYLHDIGMLRVPPEIIKKPGKLTQRELMAVRRHTIHNLDMLQRMVGHRSGLTGTVPIVAYQSHERENGSGYPKGRKGAVIHDFAKILSACDTYQAMISKRPWRKPMLPYLAMEQLVVMAARGVLAPEAVKALLNCMSLFPIGSWVEMEDGSTARVVAGSGSEYTRPVVSVLHRDGERLSKPERIDLTEEKSLNIARPIPAPSRVNDAMAAF